jgi:prepilin peptidase CpaA
MTPLPLASASLLALLVLVAAIYDIRFRRIPNWLVLTGFCLGIALNTYFAHVNGFLLSLLGAALALAVYLPFFALRAMGAGDVKLMIAIGAFVGAKNWLILFLMTALLGGILAICLLLMRGGLARAFKNVLFILGQLVRFRMPHHGDPALDVTHPHAVTLPHGVSIALGTFLFLILELLPVT